MTVITDLLCRWELYIAIVCVFFISRIVQWWLNPLRKLPGPTGLPILGNTLDFSQSNDVHQMLLERAKKYGPIYKTYSLFVGTRVNISDPAFAKRILVTNSSNYYKNDGLRSFLPAMGNGLLTSSGREHAQQRKHLNPAFSMESVKGFISVFSDKGNELVKFWDTKINESGGKSVESEMMTKFIHLTLDVIGLCGFGYAFNCIMGENSEESKATNTILTGQFNVRQRLLETFLPFLKLFPSKERDRVKKAETILYGLIEHIIATRRDEMKTSSDQTSPKRDLLQKILNLYEAAGEEISNKGVFHQMFTFLLAGHETTSLSLTWTMFLLAKNPHFQDRARKEIKEVLGDKSHVSFEDLDKLKFLDDCIKESMRLYPVAIMPSRKSLKEDKFGPYTIPANTNFGIMVGVLNRNEKIWKDPDDFNPDRFASNKGEGDPLFPYYFLPFSRGPHMCIGYRFAQMEIKVVLAQLLNSFSFRLGKNQPEHVRGKALITLNPEPAPVIEISRA